VDRYRRIHRPTDIKLTSYASFYLFQHKKCRLKIGKKLLLIPDVLDIQYNGDTAIEILVFWTMACVLVGGHMRFVEHATSAMRFTNSVALICE
jgi:hypothetical protein